MKILVIFSIFLISFSGVFAKQSKFSKKFINIKDKSLYDELQKEIQNLYKIDSKKLSCENIISRKKKSFFIEHHGYFRLRADGFYRLHLGTHLPSKGVYTSGFYPPITENQINNEGGSEYSPEEIGSKGENWISSVNMRFRYSPIFHISKNLKIFAQFDILDNLVLGSTPDYAGYQARPDVPLVAFSGTQVSPEYGKNSWRSAFSVKQLFGHFVSPVGLFRFGRMASQWGLGILANGGQKDDDDFGDFVDRLLYLVPIKDWFKIVIARDFVYEGITSDSPYEPLGQPHDLDDADDVNEYVFSIFQKPLSKEEKETEGIKLFKLHKPVFNWGFYGVYRSQDLDLTSDTFKTYYKEGIEYDQIEFVPRNAWAFIPDLWFKFLYSPKPGHLFRLEFEGVMIYGKIGNARMNKGGEPERKIFQLGGALELEYKMNQFSFGLKSGMASGDNAKYFGVLDYANLSYKDENGNTVPNKTITNFKFDRDYHVDLILFREVIGTVTNAMYFKPFVQYDFIPGDEGDFGFNLSAMYARAFEPDATPGKAPNLGVEFDLQIFLVQAKKFKAVLEWGLLFPMKAFDRIVKPCEPAHFATTIQGRFHWKF